MTHTRASLSKVDGVVEPIILNDRARGMQRFWIGNPLDFAARLTSTSTKLDVVLSRLPTMARRKYAFLRHVLGRRPPTSMPAASEALFELASRDLGIAQISIEVMAFHSFLRDREPRVICEIGTGGGGHLLMLSRIPTVTTLIGIDIQVLNRAFIRRLVPRNVSLHLLSGDSSSDAVLVALRGALRQQPIDVLFIDGDHNLSGVRKDYLNYRSLVRDGGIIAFHDIVPDHVTRFGRKTDAWTGDVPRFWRLVKQGADTREFVSSAEQDGYGIGVVIYSVSSDQTGC